MVLANQLSIQNATELAQTEEKITKQRAKQFYDEQVIDTVSVGTFAGLAEIHRYLFVYIMILLVKSGM